MLPLIALILILTSVSASERSPHGSGEVLRWQSTGRPVRTALFRAQEFKGLGFIEG